MPKLDQIVISTAHYCIGNGPSLPGDGPLSGVDTDFSRVAIVIGVEKGGYYCLDNNATP